MLGIRTTSHPVRLISFCGICCARCLSHYQILEVDQKASEAEIKSAFYKKSKLYHPDASLKKAKPDGKFVQVCEAYDVLKNKELRTKYDHFLDDKQQGFYSSMGKNENEDFKHWQLKSASFIKRDKKNERWQYGYEEYEIYSTMQLLTVPLVVLSMIAIIIYLEHKRKHNIVSSNRPSIPYYYIAQIERAQWLNKQNELNRNTVDRSSTESDEDDKPVASNSLSSSVLQTWKS